MFNYCSQTKILCSVTKNQSRIDSSRISPSLPLFVTYPHPGIWPVLWCSEAALWCYRDVIQQVFGFFFFPFLKMEHEKVEKQWQHYSCLCDYCAHVLRVTVLLAFIRRCILLRLNNQAWLTYLQLEGLGFFQLFFLRKGSHEILLMNYRSGIQLFEDGTWRSEFSGRAIWFW